MRKIEKTNNCYQDITAEQKLYIQLKKKLGYRYFSALEDAVDMSITNQRLLFRKVKGKAAVGLDFFLDSICVYKKICVAFESRRTQKRIKNAVCDKIHSKINSDTTAIERAIISKKQRVKHYFKSRFSTIINSDIEIIFTDDPSMFGCVTIPQKNRVKQLIKLDYSWWSNVHKNGLSYCNGTYTLSANLIAITNTSAYYEASWLSKIDNDQFVVSTGLLIKTIVSGQTAFYHADNLAEGVQLVINLVGKQSEVHKLPVNTH